MNIAIYIADEELQFPHIVKLIQLLKEKHKNKNNVLLIRNMRELKTLSNIQLLHLFSSRPYTLKKLFFSPRVKDIPFIFTSLEAFTEWNMKPKSLKSLISGQTKVQNFWQNVDVIHVFGQSEMQQIKKFIKDKSIAIIPNPIISNAISEEDFVTHMSQVYIKIMKKYPRCALNLNHIRLIFDFIYASVENKPQLMQSILKSMDNLDENIWVNMLLHVKNQEIMHYFKKGLETTGYTFKPEVQKNIEEVPQLKAQQQPSPDSTSLITTFDINEWLSSPIHPETRIVMMTKQLKAQHKKKIKIKALHLLYLYVHLRHCDLDEALLIRMLKVEKLTRFFSRILNLLTIGFSLTEGFMPIPQIEEKKNSALIAEAF